MYMCVCVYLCIHPHLELGEHDDGDVLVGPHVEGEVELGLRDDGLRLDGARELGEILEGLLN
eukprot:596684-Amorphochlora_amoeboformis.AAC.1